jgi:hypothetical protein
VNGSDILNEPGLFVLGQFCHIGLNVAETRWLSPVMRKVTNTLFSRRGQSVICEIGGASGREINCSQWKIPMRVFQIKCGQKGF